MHAGDRGEIFRILEGGKASKRERSGQKSEKSGRREIESNGCMREIEARLFGFWGEEKPLREKRVARNRKIWEAGDRK